MRPLKIWAFPGDSGILGGRTRAKRVRAKILIELSSLPPDGVLEISFSPVRFIDFSAADEILTGLIARVASGELGSRRFYLVGVNEAVRETLSAVLELQKRQCLEVRASGSVAILGHLSPQHVETLEWVITQGQVTVADVARHFWKEPKMTAATNRLNQLAGAGLLIRMSHRGGPTKERYTYSSFMGPKEPIPDTTDDSPEEA